MSIRMPLIASLLIIAAMAGLSLWAWSQISPDMQLPVHWGWDGNANGYAGKTPALVMFPLISLGLTALFCAIPRIEPRRFNLAASVKFYRAAWIGTLLLMGIVHGAIVFSALHMVRDAAQIVMPAIGVLFVVIGNYLAKSRSNFFAGVRTPWTLSSDYSWEKTHRLTGRLFVLCGIATIAASILSGEKPAAIVLLAGVTGSALTGIAASYFYWRRDPLRHTSDGAPE